MAKPIPIEPSKTARVHYGDYKRLCRATNTEIKQVRDGNKPSVKLYLSDHRQILSLSHLRAAQTHKPTSMADIIHEILPAGAIPKPDNPPNTTANIIHGLLAARKT